MGIHKNTFYKGDVDKREYTQAQIERHRVKREKKRKKEHYRQCANEMVEFVKEGGDMVCLGTRNNHERDCFNEFLGKKSVKVFSLDISPLSKADIIMDFNEFPDEWENKWDVLFSNALDHSIDATKSLEEWVRIVKINGILVIGLSATSKDENLSEHDCCSFDLGHVDKFMREENSLFTFVSCLDNGYVYYTLRKK